MISPMTKYSFILLSGDKDKFLDEVRALGVVDITRSVKPVDDKSAAMLEEAGKVRKALGIVERADYSKDADLADIEACPVKTGNVAVTEKVSLALEAADRLEALRLELQAAEKERKSREPWGVFDKDKLAGLAAEGYVLRYYIVPRKKFSEEWASLVPLQVVNANADSVWFVTVVPASEEYTFPVAEVNAPAGDVADAEKNIAGIHDEMVGQKAVLLSLKSSTDELSAEYRRILGELDLYLADTAGERSSENMVTSFVGFAPAADDARLSEAFDGMDVYWWKEDAVEEDNPPIKLRNNKFISMFEVLTGMYGMPVYSEFDPTPILGPFFLLFFSMCLGDAGYGLLLVLIGWYLKKKMPSMASMAPLVITLGIGTIVVGTIMGSLFGVSLVEASWVPDWMKRCMLQGTIAGFSINMVLAVAIGVFHICLAMVVKALCYTKRFGLKATISNWAWNLLIIGGLIVAGMAFAGVMDEKVTKIVVIVLGCVSGLGIYVFNTPGRNPLINVGAGLWDTYNMITGLMGDVLSYIRLYALGLAGGMLGLAFNNIASMVLDGVPVPGLNWVFFIIVLLFGHALNLAMSCLGAFVHPLRLTFVEYFKNSGYEGTGKRYNPLTVDGKNE